MCQIEEQNAFERLSRQRLRASLHLGVILVKGDARRLLRELHGEVSLATVSPGLGGAASGEGIGGDALERSCDHRQLAIVQVPMLQIDDDVSALCV